MGYCSPRWRTRNIRFLAPLSLLKTRLVFFPCREQRAIPWKIALVSKLTNLKCIDGVNVGPAKYVFRGRRETLGHAVAAASTLVLIVSHLGWKSGSKADIPRPSHVSNAGNPCLAKKFRRFVGQECSRNTCSSCQKRNTRTTQTRRGVRKKVAGGYC